jgi:hypothetical protein
MRAEAQRRRLRRIPALDPARMKLYPARLFPVVVAEFSLRVYFWVTPYAKLGRPVKRNFNFFISFFAAKPPHTAPRRPVALSHVEPG